MNRLLVTALGLGLAATTGVASAQSYGQPYGSSYGSSQQVGDYNSSQVDYARVIRVDPVFDNYTSQPVNQGQRCYERPTYVQGDSYYGNEYEPRRDDGYYDQYGNQRRAVGTEGGRTAATVVGGIVGAVLGSKVGGGSARYATSALGSMVGGMAGRSIYEQSKRSQEPRTGTVRVCDPVPANGSGNYYSGGERSVSAYDVTYEYAGKTYRTRTNHNPGDRIRVRVDVRPD
ncbi:glycine zipper 2TM domain-containing protein [Lysobacter sp. CA196]|uniref:glycine zipper 2TM domain-containing protein n=1 Tax=Lysobacter sp. CA196 TaxID=3455606 RepID=UPI003F8D5F82